MRNSIKTYQTIKVESSINNADPHTIISMLFEGVFQSISITKGAIERRDLQTKSVQLNKAMSILRSLQDSLDTESEPTISATFYDLYAYCIDRLIEASVSLDYTILDQVINLLKPLATAWKEMPEVNKKEGFALLKSKETAS